MAIGRISGSVLKSNLTRNGVDLAFETNLLYLDVTNSRVGIGTSEPTTTLQVNGTTTTTGLTANGAIDIDGTGTSNIDNVIIGANTPVAGTFTTLNANTSATLASGSTAGTLTLANGSITDSSGAISFGDENLTTTGTLTVSGFTFPSADGSNGQVLQTDGAGNISFAESSGGGGGNNTAVKQFNHYKLGTTSAVVDEFDITEYRGAIYDIVMEDQDNGFVGHLKVSVVHDDTTPYVSTYNVNEDSTRIADFTVAISGDMVQLSASTNTSSHTNLRVYRVALGDHHETVANTNSKIIATSTNIGSSATTLDQFTKTDIRGAKYIILIKDDTAGDYQISETSLTHDGTTVYHDDYALVSSRGTPLHTISASISGATVTLSSASGGNTTGTAILYRQDLGSKTKLGEFDNFLYGVKGDIDSAVETVDSFDVFKYKSARYFIAMESGSEYQNSEVTLVVNNAGTDATIIESFVLSANNNLATFSADVSSGKARLRASCNPNTKIYFARLSMEAENIYRASGQTADDLYITHNNFTLSDSLADFSGVTGGLTLPSGTSAQQPSDGTGVLRYNTSLSRYEKWDGSAFVDITATAAAAADTDNITLPTPESGVGTTQSVIDQFTTGSFDSAFYYAVTRDEINNDVATERYTLVHNDSDAFVSSSNGVQSGSAEHMSVDADISGGNVRLLATGASVVNSVTLYRIGLGDSTTTGSAGNTATLLNTDVDSATENLDTWSASTYRGAKYFISVNAANGELSNLEAAVVTDGSDAFITIYNEIFTGNDPLLLLTADVSGGEVRLRASGYTPNCNVKMYRILLGDSETTATGDNIKTVGASSVSSSSTAIDTFSTDSFTGAQYVVVGYNSAEGAASISEVHVVTDGSDAYVSAGPLVSSKGTDQLSFTAALSGTTVTLSAASTSGGSTTVNAWRVSLLRAEAGAPTSNTVLVDTEQTITGQKTFSEEVSLNSISSSDSSAVTINDNLKVTGLTTDNAFLINAGDGTIGETTTLTVDPASNYLGINQTSPEVTLHMTGEGAQTAQIRMEQYNDTADAPDVRTRRYRGTIASPSAVQSGDYLFRSNHEYWNGTSLITGGSFAFDNTNNAARTQFAVAVDTDGTGANVQGNNGQFIIDGNAGGRIKMNTAVALAVNSDPDTITNYAHIYAKDEASSAEVFVKDEAGNVTKISPHNQEGEWEYYSRNTKTGKTVRINMEEMIRDIEKLTGKTYIKND